MPWATVANASFAEGDAGRWRFIIAPVVTGAIALGLAIDTSASGTLPRRRVGFMAPFAEVSDLQATGVVTTVFQNLEGEPPAVHIIDYRFLDAYGGLRGRVTAFGVAFTPDRGAFPLVLALVVLT